MSLFVVVINCFKSIKDYRQLWILFRGFSHTARHLEQLHYLIVSPTYMLMLRKILQVSIIIITHILEIRKPRLRVGKQIIQYHTTAQCWSFYLALAFWF